MKIRKPRSERIPRSIEQRLRDVQKRPTPDVAVAKLTKDIGQKVEALREGTDAAASIKTYILAHQTEWALRIRSQYNELLTEIDSLAGEAHALVVYRRILCENQRDVLDDLDVAVAHALERVTDPDAPYHEPIRWSERKGRQR
jgi:hypothetical protein